jgi:hypothetical protein
MPIRHAEWGVRSSQLIKLSSYTRAVPEGLVPARKRHHEGLGCSASANPYFSRSAFRFLGAAKRVERGGWPLEARSGGLTNAVLDQV